MGSWVGWSSSHNSRALCALIVNLSCFVYWCTNGVAHLGDDLDNKKYSKVVPADMESFLKSCKMAELAVADRHLGL
jgi:hypothetical protein